MGALIVWAAARLRSTTVCINSFGCWLPVCARALFVCCRSTLRCVCSESFACLCLVTQDLYELHKAFQLQLETECKAWLTATAEQASSQLRKLARRACLPLIRGRSCDASFAPYRTAPSRSMPPPLAPGRSFVLLCMPRQTIRHTENDDGGAAGRRVPERVRQVLAVHRVREQLRQERAPPQTTRGRAPDPQERHAGGRFACVRYCVPLCTCALRWGWALRWCPFGAGWLADWASFRARLTAVS